MKKGQTDTIFNWAFYRIPIILFVVVFFAVILRSYYAEGLASHEVENIILIKRLVYSEELLAYRDPNTGRVYPGIVDSSKFSTTHIEESMPNPNNRIAANLELTYLDTGEVKRAYVNEIRARAWDDYVVLEGFDASTLRRYVQIYDDQIFHPGILKVKVLVKQ